MSEQRDLTHAIARALGPEWSTNQNEYTDYLVGPGLQLHVQLDSYGRERKLHIGLAATNGLAQHKGGRDVIPRIGVNPSRGAEAIAKDITRRLLPDARVMLAKLVERRDKAVADETTCQALLGRIAKALGVSPPLPDSDYGRSHRFYAYLAVGTVEVEVYRETATLKLRTLPPEIAVAVCKLLREASNGNN